MNLDELKIGQIAKILAVQESLFRDKLMEMGCVPGALIKTILRAPMGDPMAFELEGYTLSMRKAEAKTISIQLIKQNI
ncbi:ferrous iron transport protein A [bacterium]|jgi:ferrous iron transport protein A|nr:ferrous iron transport protein A [bacterium]